MSVIDRVKRVFGERPAWMSASDARIVDIGWLLDTDKAQFVWPDPQRVRRGDPAPTHKKSVNYCPSVLDHVARMFEIPCPIDVRLQFRRGEKGVPVLANAVGFII